jgi:hypothetical protein
MAKNPGTAEDARYVRPSHDSPLTPQEKTQLLLDHFDHYAAIVKSDPALLNAKLPRQAFNGLLHKVGRLLFTEASRLANTDGPVRDFLNKHALPESMRERLPPDFRALCLAMNALKQWVAAEQAATDRYLLGGTARARCRKLATTCLVTGEPLDLKSMELHHPVRDGRPPIPLSKNGHAIIENQNGRAALSGSGDDSGGSAKTRLSVDKIHEALRTLKAQRHYSWVMLRRGCLDRLGQPANHTTPAVGASSRVFARKAMTATGLSAVELLEWLDRNAL